MGNRKYNVRQDIDEYEANIRKAWTKRANKKNKRIIGKGYAERQIQNSLMLAGKVKKEL